MNPIPSRTFVTRDLSAGQNVLQAGWAKSKSGLLDRLEVDGTRLTIRLRDGAVHELTPGKFRCTSYRTGSGRRLFVIRTDDGRKVRFLEMDEMLSAEEWDTIADEVLGAVPSNLNRNLTLGGYSLVLGMLAAALTAGFLGGLLHLPAEQFAFTSPLALGLMAGWTVLIWIGFWRLR